MTEERDEELQAQLDALPREIEPARDLWPAIADRLEERKVTPLRTGGGRPAYGAWGGGLLAAAAGLALWWGTTTETTTPEAQPTAIAPRPVPARPLPDPAAIPTRLSYLVPGEEDYRRASTVLAQAVDERRAELPDDLARVYDENVVVVDRAIDEARTALAENPDDEQLQGVLDEAYRQKLDLLQQIASVPVRS